LNQFADYAKSKAAIGNGQCAHTYLENAIKLVPSALSDAAFEELTPPRWSSLKVERPSLSGSWPMPRSRRPLLHPEMATFYREQVGALHEALQVEIAGIGFEPMTFRL
jgi:hypothetical protein